ncbi:amidase family protein [Colletotrichum incanum]|uniref:Amidase family protein n=1 Tax=Colletotrichum incanum TaxID=1573173 RepID=A0A167E0T0_COLIC|nr:amidase family protein [Colletotrichum incanum]
MILKNTVTNAHNTDTARVFAHNPEKWTASSKAWYDTSLHKQTFLNGLPDHLPLQKPAAEAILQQFLSDASATLVVTVKNFNLSATIENVAGWPLLEILSDLNVFWTHDLIRDTAKPLLARYGPNFPPLDEHYRQVIHSSAVRRRV